jgi:hypothetical protein
MVGRAGGSVHLATGSLSPAGLGAAAVPVTLVQYEEVYQPDVRLTMAAERVMRAAWEELHPGETRRFDVRWFETTDDAPEFREDHGDGAGRFTADDDVVSGWWESDDPTDVPTEIWILAGLPWRETLRLAAHETARAAGWNGAALDFEERWYQLWRT